MTVEELLIYGKKYIHSDHVKLLLSDLLELNPLELLMHLNDYVDNEKCELFKESVLALKEGNPIQYVLGHVNFYGEDFYINKDVLIPRFETEELVENTINYIKERFPGNIKILDIGCGSGVIGLTLKKYIKDAKIDLVDISSKALDVARINAKKMNLEVDLIESDLFSNVEGKYDVIISNPPYIGEDEEIEVIVRDNEPNIALYAGEEGLDIYKSILKEVENYTNSKYMIAFEIGSTQKDKLIELINKELNDIEIITKKDLSGRDRMIFIFKNE